MPTVDTAKAKASRGSHAVAPRQTARLDARLEARISVDLHGLLKRAAEIEGRTMTDFVVAAVQAAAQRSVERAEVIQFSLADQERFAQALLKPPAPTAPLKRAFKRQQKLLA